MTIALKRRMNKKYGLITGFFSALMILLIVGGIDKLLIDKNSTHVNVAIPNDKPEKYASLSAGPDIDLNGKNTTVIAFTGFSPSIDFWAKIIRAVHAKAKQMNIVIAEYSVDTCQQQIACIHNAIAAGVKGIIIGPICDEVSVAVGDAQKANIPVIAIDVPIRHSWVSTQVGTDNYAAGELAGTLLLKKIKASKINGGRVIVLTGDQSQSNASTRALGLSKVMNEAAITVTVRYSKDWSGANTLNNLLEELSTDGEKTVGIFATFAPGTIAMVEGTEFMNVPAFLVGFDMNPVIKEMISAGRLGATITQRPTLIGEKSVVLMVELLNGKEIPKKIDIPVRVLTKDNLNTEVNE